MIGKNISDRFGLTELLGGKVAQVYEPIVELYVEDDEWKTLINEIKAADGDTVKIKLAIDKAGLSDVDGLNDYVINQVNNGKKIDNESVNSLIQSQNYQNIADEAHGYKGVKQAIDAYNESLQKNDDNITIATNNTNKFIDTLSKTNPQLAGCMRNAEGSTISFSNYAGSLIKAKIQTIGLQAATTAMNAAISFGVSFVISGLVSLIQYAVSANKRFIEAQQNIIDSSNDIIQKNEEEITSLEELQTALKEAGTNKQELAKISEDLNKTIGHTEGLLNGEISASIEISNSVHPMDTFFDTFVFDDKTLIKIVKDGETIVTLDDYEVNNSYQEIQDNEWQNDNYTISLNKQIITSQDIVSET